MQISSIVLKHQDMVSPCVYYVIKGDVITYIGVGTKGMGRVFSGFESQQKDRTRAIKNCSQIKIRFFKTTKEALNIEGDEIHRHHPKHNGFCSRCTYYILKRPKRLNGRGLLFGIARHSILSLFLNHSGKSFGVRETARLTEMSLGPVQREIKGLLKSGIINRTVIGNQVRYQVAEQHPIFNELRSMVAKGA